MPRHILVVDDEPGIREMLAAWLNAAGYDCDQAGDAEGALAAAERRTPDVALLDLALPDKDGLWLAAALRSRHEDTALIVVTGLHGFDVALQGTRVGVLDYLVKPFTRGDLCDAVQAALAWRDRQLRRRVRCEQLAANGPGRLTGT